jgi:hypothetical protein
MPLLLAGKQTGLTNAMTLTTELGPEQACRRCGELWPADAEFFISSKGRLQTLCRACNSRERAAAPCQCELEALWHSAASVPERERHRRPDAA